MSEISRVITDRSRRDRESGAAAVEFALVLPLLILLLFGIIAFGIAFSGWLGSNNSAREAARAGVVLNSTCSEIATSYLDAGVPLGVNSPVTLEIARTGGPTCRTTLVNTSGTWSVSSSWSAGSAATIPCRSSTSGNDTLLVTARSPLGLSIPLWGNANVTIQGKGAFRCEFS